MAMEVNVTKEVREAIIEEYLLTMCEEQGHVPDFNMALQSVDFIDNDEEEDDEKKSVRRRRPKVAIQGPENRLPHVSCRRCGTSWIIYPDPGISYEVAEAKFYTHLKADTPTARDIIKKRARRKESGKAQPKKEET